MKSQQTFSVIFLARKRNNDPDFSIIYARISVNGHRTEFSIKQKIPSALWDRNRGQLKGNGLQSKKLNQYLDQMRSEIFDAYDQLRKGGDILSAEAIKARFLNEDNNNTTLLDAIKYHYKIAQQTIRPGTLKNYRTTEKYVQLFLKEEMKREDIFLSKVRYSFLTKFENYLRMYVPVDHHKRMGNNTVMKHIQRLRKIVTMAVKLEWISKDPFANFKASYIRKEREFLSEKELAKIENKNLTIERLVYVRDLFVFSCYTGLSYIDVVNLTEDNLVRGIDGDWWIHTSRTKTGQSVKVPLLDKASAMIEKYRDHPKALYHGTLFPKISNQKLNAYLKEIADLCRIKKNITFHLARHTFATTVTLTNGVPLATVSKLLGHAKITTTQIYAKVVETKVSEDMQRLKQQLASKRDANPTKHIKRIS